MRPVMPASSQASPMNVLTSAGAPYGTYGEKQSASPGDVTRVMEGCRKINEWSPGVAYELRPLPVVLHLFRNRLWGEPSDWRGL